MPKKTKLYTTIVIFLLLFSFVVIPQFSAYDYPKQGTSYYVSNGGNNANNGTHPHYPWETIAKVNSEFGSDISQGDDIFFERGDYFNDVQFALWSVGGEEGNMMIIGAYGTGPDPIFNCTSGSQIAVTNAVDHVKLENLNITGGTATYGLNFDKGCGASDIHWSNLTFYGDQNIIRDTSGYLIENCVFKPLSIGLHGITIGEGASNGIVRDCVVSTQSKDGINFHFAGTNDISAATCVGSNHLLERINITGATGDNAMDLVGGYVCQNVRVRNINISASSFVSIGHEQRNLLVENVYREGTGNSWSFTDGHNITVRNCIINGWTNNGITTDDGQYFPWGSTDVIMYNCDIISDGDADFMQCNGDSDEWDGFILKNNIWMSTAMSSPGTYIHYIAPATLTNMNTNWSYNMWWRGDGIGTSEVWQSAQGVTNNFTEWQANSEVSHELLDNPEFVSIGEEDFSLNSTSPCIDAGAWLTQTDGSGTGQWITVEESNYFFPRLEDLGPYDEDILGDNIFVGENINLEVLELNCVNESFKVNRSITWSDDDNVSLSSYSGTKVDIGAKEYIPTSSPPVASNPNPGNGVTGVSIGLTEINITITDTDGNNTNGTIETSPDIGNSTWVNQPDGTFNCTIGGLSHYTIYNWYVNFTDGNYDVNETYSFTTETIYIISIDGNGNNTIIYNKTPTFKWSIVNNTSQYWLQISNQSDWITFVVNLSNISEVNFPTYYSQDGVEVTFNLPSSYGLPEVNIYYCRVRSYAKN